MRNPLCGNSEEFFFCRVQNLKLRSHFQQKQSVRIQFRFVRGQNIVLIFISLAFREGHGVIQELQKSVISARTD